MYHQSTFWNLSSIEESHAFSTVDSSFIWCQVQEALPTLTKNLQTWPCSLWYQRQYQRQSLVLQRFQGCETTSKTDGFKSQVSGNLVCSKSTVHRMALWVSLENTNRTDLDGQRPISQRGHQSSTRSKEQEQQEQRTTLEAQRSATTIDSKKLWATVVQNLDGTTEKCNRTAPIATRTAPTKQYLGKRRQLYGNGNITYIKWHKPRSGNIGRTVPNALLRFNKGHTHSPQHARLQNYPD